MGRPLVFVAGTTVGGGMAGVESRKEVVVAAPKGALFAKSRTRPADLSSAQRVGTRVRV